MHDLILKRKVEMEQKAAEIIMKAATDFFYSMNDTLCLEKPYIEKDKYDKIDYRMMRASAYLYCFDEFINKSFMAFWTRGTFIANSCLEMRHQQGKIKDFYLDQEKEFFEYLENLKSLISKIILNV